MSCIKTAGRMFADWVVANFLNDPAIAPILRDTFQPIDDARGGELEEPFG